MTHIQKRSDGSQQRNISLQWEKKYLQWPAKVADTPQTNTDDTSLSLSSSNTQNKLLSTTEVKFYIFLQYFLSSYRTEHPAIVVCKTSH